MKNKESCEKTYRMINIYEALEKGELVNKKTLSDKFKVDERTIQRDIDDLRGYLTDFYQDDVDLYIEYDRTKKGYSLKRKDANYLTDEEILAVSKVLLESRAFTEQEMNLLLDKLVLQSSAITRNSIKEVIANERFHFVPLNNSKPLLKKIWELSSAVRKKRKIELEYSKLYEEKGIKRKINPVGIIFSEFYFYLIAYVDGLNYEFPAIYRIDRIEKYEILDEDFVIEEKDRFEEGEYRKLIQFMYAGELLKIKFKFYGKSIEAVMDRLPNAEVVGKEEDCTIIEAKVFGKGIKRWILSQSEYIEVLEPIEFREEIKEAISKMSEIYEKK